VCYKPHMRKWIGERLKRRKKKSEESKSEPQAAPLQPAYFDAAEPPQPSPPEEKEPELKEEPAATTDSSVKESVRPPHFPEADNARRPSRRRRGRGGRGRRGTLPQTTPASAQGVSFVGEASPSAASAPQIPIGETSTAPRPPKGVVVLAIGLPGSGKSAWFKRHSITPLSSDMLRALLFDDPGEQRFQDLVFSNLRSMLKARLIARRPTNYVDATNLTPQDRHAWIKLAHDFGYEVQAVYFDVPLEVCLERNQKRQRLVEEDVLRRMAGKLKAPGFEEGFTKITVVKVKQKE
jgi:predicted kinase